jgi:hypothetical protein
MPARENRASAWANTATLDTSAGCVPFVVSILRRGHQCRVTHARARARTHTHTHTHSECFCCSNCMSLLALKRVVAWLGSLLSPGGRSRGCLSWPWKGSFLLVLGAELLCGRFPQYKHVRLHCKTQYITLNGNIWTIYYIVWWIKMQDIKIISLPLP